jgi:hypothetical protein
VSGDCSLQIVIPTTTDACAGIISGTTNNQFEFTSDSTYVITWTFKDESGNSIQAKQNVIISDTIPPELPALPDLYANCSITVPTPSAIDGCSGEVLGTTTDALEYLQQGTYNITWTFTDSSGNSINGSQSIIIDDTIAPSLTCIENQTINLPEGINSYTVQESEFDPDVVDNCNVISLINNFNQSSSLNGATLSLGTNIIKWQVSDIAGNIVECSNEIIINNAITSLSKQESESISIFPSPTSGIININNLKGQNNMVTIIDVYGRIHKQIELQDNNSKINISNLESGVYFVLLKFEEKLISKPMIKID